MATPRWKLNRVEWARKNKRKLGLLACKLTPAEIRFLSKEEAVEKLLAVVEAWEAVTSRSQDLPRERLEEETASQVKQHLVWYCSEQARALMAEDLVEIIQQIA